jgi:hypothetical protein
MSNALGCFRAVAQPGAPISGSALRVMPAAHKPWAHVAESGMHAAADVRGAGGVYALSGRPRGTTPV